nr:MAG TPA: hypothetical protein [Caudoviricetes sp.]
MIPIRKINCVSRSSSVVKPAAAIFNAVGRKGEAQPCL